MAEGGASRQSLSKPLDLLAGQLLPMLLSRLRQQARSASAERAPPPSITHETAAGQFVATGRVLQPLHPGPAPLDHVRKAYQALDVRSALELRAAVEGRIAKT